MKKIRLPKTFIWFWQRTVVIVLLWIKLLWKHFVVECFFLFPILLGHVLRRVCPHTIPHTDDAQILGTWSNRWLNFMWWCLLGSAVHVAVLYFIYKLPTLHKTCISNYIYIIFYMVLSYFILYCILITS
jgi:hypothetical protein